MKYTLEILTKKNVTQTTLHDSKKTIKEEVNSWNDHDLIAKVIDNDDEEIVFFGSASLFN